jgi:SAM-dependent methyltransferase
MRSLWQLFKRAVGNPEGTLPADRLSAEGWHNVLIGPSTQNEVVERVRSGAHSEWCRFLVNTTAPGESVLEIASGTGEISLLLATLGRRVTLLDLSPENLSFSQRCADRLGVEIRTCQVDVLQGTPFADEEFDCSWSSGLLEHFAAPERQAILREKARITRSWVISLVPNAACLAYRIGKADQEARGVWPYGLETPLASQREDFTAAGLETIRECTVGAKHAASFLVRSKPLSRELSRWIAGQPESVLLEYRQGYLLATVGTPPPLARVRGGTL